MSEQSTLNRVLFGSENAWIAANRAAQDGSVPPPNRYRRGHNAEADTLQSWAGRSHSADLDQEWELVFADGGLWVVPPNEAAQLLSPNGPDGLRSRGVNLWFAADSFLVAAVDELTGDWIDGLWFERRAG